MFLTQNSTVYASDQVPAPVKDHSLAANFSKWLPKTNIYTTSLQTLKAELAAENAAKAVSRG